MTQAAPTVDWFSDWQAMAVDAAGFRCDPMDLASSSDWAFSDGSLQHRTGRFFSVIGIEETSGISYPLVDQPDIGLLGFLVAGEPGSTSWLVQMKVEPGNVGAAQLAPTLQATRSNLDRMHAGTGPPFENEFGSVVAGVISDGLWSEQGSRFLGKRNRNMTIRTTVLPEADGVNHRWIDGADLRAALATDFAVNTDARSVIATAPWELVGPSRLFRGELRHSYLHHEAGAGARVAASLSRARSIGLRRVPLHDLPGAVLDESPTPLRHPFFDVVHRSVTATTREVPAWDQPLIAAAGSGRIDLVLRRGDDGILRAVLSVDASAGLMAGPELTASRVDPPGAIIGPTPRGEVISRTEISDEGGRFDHAVSTVTISIGDPVLDGPFVELSLGDLERIVRSPMKTTNELRTAVAQLLALA